MMGNLGRMGNLGLTPNKGGEYAGDTQDETGRYLLTAFLIFSDEAEAIATLDELWTEPEIEPVPAEEA